MKGHFTCIYLFKDNPAILQTGSCWVWIVWLSKTTLLPSCRPFPWCLEAIIASMSIIHYNWLQHWSFCRGMWLKIVLTYDLLNVCDYAKLCTTVMPILFDLLTNTISFFYICFRYFFSINPEKGTKVERGTTRRLNVNPRVLTLIQELSDHEWCDVWIWTEMAEVCGMWCHTTSWGSWFQICLCRSEKWNLKHTLWIINFQTPPPHIRHTGL